MKTIIIINKTLIGLIITTVFFFLVGVTYSFFTSGLTGQEKSTTVTIDSGYFEIVYNGGPEVFASNIYPSTEAFATKTFTVTGTNTTTIDMPYKLSINIVENTFSNNAISFSLESTNEAQNGEVVPEVIDRSSIGTLEKVIGYGKFEGEINGGVHNYKLKFYFYENYFDQSEDMRKTFKAYIKIEEDHFVGNPDNNLRTKIIAQGGGVPTIVAKGNPDFSVVSTSVDTGLYASVDDYGTSYYYRGNKDLLNNNLLFGGFQWKIIRINGDESIRIMYNGTEEQFNTNGRVNDTGTNTAIGITYTWNSTYNDDAKYIGYMYGGANGVNSTSRAETVLNQTNSNAKTKLDLWYQNNISGKIIEDSIIDNLFCNDRQLYHEIGGPYSGPGFGAVNASYFAALYRLQKNKTPTLKCGFKNDRFTVSDTSLGNGALTYPVGLINADEALMAGLIFAKEDFTNYLYSGRWYYTFTPALLSLEDGAIVWTVRSNGGTGSFEVFAEGGLRPVINLNPNIVVTGEGTATNPYKHIY